MQKLTFLFFFLFFYIFLSGFPLKKHFKIYFFGEKEVTFVLKISWFILWRKINQNSNILSRELKRNVQNWKKYYIEPRNEKWKSFVICLSYLFCSFYCKARNKNHTVEVNSMTKLTMKLILQISWASWVLKIDLVMSYANSTIQTILNCIWSVISEI